MDLNNLSADNFLNFNELLFGLKTFFNASKQGYIFIKSNGEINDINVIITEITGYSERELIGKPFSFVIPETDKENIEKIIRNLPTSANERIESALLAKDNRILNAVLNFTKLSSDSNATQGAAIVVEDILKYTKTIDSLSSQNHVLQKEIEDTNAKFLTLSDNSRDILYSVFYKDLTFEYLSPCVIEITGYTREEVMSMRHDKLLQIIHPDFRDMYRKYWKSLTECNDQLNHTLEYKIRPKEGISRWLSDHHKLIFDDKGNLVKLIGNIRDITDYKLVEDALTRSRDRLYKAIEATNDGMWDWRLNTNKVYFDARFYTMLGYDPLEFPPDINEWLNRIHPDDINYTRTLLNEHLQGRSDQWLIEYRFKAKNNEWIWLLNRGKVFERDSNGKPLRMVGTHSDITLRKKAEAEVQKRNEELQIIYEQLQISEEKFRQLADNTEDVFWLRDADQVIYVNPAFDKIWGHSRNEIFANPKILQDWIHPEDKYLFNAWLPFNTFEKEKLHIEQYRIITPGGEIRWLWSRTFAVYNDKNQIYRVAGIMSDITEQKLNESALIAAKERALESDRLKSAFLANISHEIRTPMNGIIGFAELLKDESLTIDSRLQYVNIITKSSEQLLHIIDDIIDISKIEANQLNISKTKFNLVDLINELQVFYENEKIHLGKSHIEIITDIDHSALQLEIVTDESRLRQIFMNLISNALKFTEHGYVKFGFIVQSAQLIEFFVEDTGIGIANDMQEVIFKRFRQIDDSLTRKFGGTGLGLAICEGLVKLLGGTIWVKSDKGKGSTFYFTLPVNKSPENKITVIKETDKFDYIDWTGKTILCVEDDDINQEFLSAVLSATKATLLFASTGEEAVSICSFEKQIDLVLMDIRLPVMSGYEAFDAIHKNQPSLKIIAQTAFAMTEDAQHCIQHGFTDYIAKPINRKQLLSMMNKYLQKK